MKAKLLLLIGAITAGTLFFKKSMNLQTFSKAFDYKVQVKNFRFHTWKEIRFNLFIEVLNPSNLSITVAHPLIQVFYENKMLARSTYNIPKITIKPNGSSQLPPVEFKFPLLSNWSTLSSMMRQIFKGVSIKNIRSAKTMLEKNQAAFLKLLRVQFTGQMNNTPFTKSFNLG